MQLVAINGRLAGTALTLADGLIIEAPSKGEDDRVYCHVRAEAEGTFALHTLDDHAAVFANGLPVTTLVREQIVSHRPSGSNQIGTTSSASGSDVDSPVARAGNESKDHHSSWRSL